MESNLESKFIEGTNNQYSIRNDGVVIRHFSLTRHGTYSYKSYTMKIHSSVDIRKVNRINIAFVNLRGKVYVLKSLVLKYFPIPLPENNSVHQVKHKDNNYLNCSVDNLFYMYHNNQEDKNRLKREINQKERDSISFGYIASKLNIPVSSLSDELYELHKALILLKRLIKSKKKCQIQQ